MSVRAVSRLFNRLTADGLFSNRDSKRLVTSTRLNGVSRQERRFLRDRFEFTKNDRVVPAEQPGYDRLHRLAFHAHHRRPH